MLFRARCVVTDFKAEMVQCGNLLPEFSYVARLEDHSAGNTADILLGMVFHGRILFYAVRHSVAPCRE